MSAAPPVVPALVEGARSLVHYLPLVTTAVAVPFCISLALRFRSRGGAHHAWWAVGVFAYGLGTAIEGAITLFGNSARATAAWYAAGAVLGAYPLAQGSVHLLLRPRLARALSLVSLPLVAAVALGALTSPVDLAQLEDTRPTVSAIERTWVRRAVPFVNLYAAAFLVGGAALSAVRLRRVPGGGPAARGNAWIALGAILPGIGGAAARGGAVEALYVTELVGLLLIFHGYRLATRGSGRVAERPANSADAPA